MLEIDGIDKVLVLKVGLLTLPSWYIDRGVVGMLKTTGEGCFESETCHALLFGSSLLPFLLGGVFLHGVNVERVFMDLDNSRMVCRRSID